MWWCVLFLTHHRFTLVAVRWMSTIGSSEISMPEPWSFELARRHLMTSSLGTTYQQLNGNLRRVLRLNDKYFLVEFSPSLDRKRLRVTLFGEPSEGQVCADEKYCKTNFRLRPSPKTSLSHDVSSKDTRSSHPRFQRFKNYSNPFSV